MSPTSGNTAGKDGLTRKRKKNKRKVRKPEFEGPSLRDHLLAGAYGGVALPKPKRHGTKQITDVDAGLRDIATPGVLRDSLSRRYPNALAHHGSLSSLDGEVTSQRGR